MIEFKIQPCTKENATAIISGINTYNLSKVVALAHDWTPLDFVIKNDAGVEIAGILAGVGYWNGLDIKFYGWPKPIVKQGLAVLC